MEKPTFIFEKGEYQFHYPRNMVAKDLKKFRALKVQHDLGSIKSNENITILINSKDHEYVVSRGGYLFIYYPKRK